MNFAKLWATITSGSGVLLGGLVAFGIVTAPQSAAIAVVLTGIGGMIAAFTGPKKENDR